MREKTKEELEQAIELKRKEMEGLYDKHLSFVHNEVVKVSQELDVLLSEYQKRFK